MTQGELKIFKKLNKPWLIQDYLEKIPINFEENGETLMSPRRVLQEKRAHCFEGALFAAAAFQINNHSPLLLDLCTTDADESHVVALFKYNGRWGAVSKTNHAVLRYRDPVYKNIRELVMSYYHEYFLNSNREKTLRSYSEPFDLRKLKNQDWMTTKEDLWHLDEILDKQKHYSIIPSKNIEIIRKADPIEKKAGSIIEWKKG